MRERMLNAFLGTYTIYPVLVPAHRSSNQLNISFYILPFHLLSYCKPLVRMFVCRCWYEERMQWVTLHIPIMVIVLTYLAWSYLPSDSILHSSYLIVLHTWSHSSQHFFSIYSSFPDALSMSNIISFSIWTVVTEFIRLAAVNGMDVFRIFDCFNDIESMKVCVNLVMTLT